MSDLDTTKQESRRVGLIASLPDDIKERAQDNLILAGKVYGKGSQNSAKAIEPIDTRLELAKLAEVSHDTMGKVIYIEKYGFAEEKEKLVNGEASINEIHRKVKKRMTKTEVEPPPLPEGKYNIIYADPPWRYDFSETDSRKIENQYPTMSLEARIGDANLCSPFQVYFAQNKPPGGTKFPCQTPQTQRKQRLTW